MLFITLATKLHAHDDWIDHSNNQMDNLNASWSLKKKCLRLLLLKETKDAIILIKQLNNITVQNTFLNDTIFKFFGYKP